MPSLGSTRYEPKKYRREERKGIKASKDRKKGKKEMKERETSINNPLGLGPGSFRFGPKVWRGPPASNQIPSICWGGNFRNSND